MQYLRCYAFLLLICIISSNAWSHQIATPDPSASELSKTQPPMKGSEEFARQVLRHLKNRFDAKQMEKLDSIASRMLQAERVRWVKDNNKKTKVAEYHRWQAEQDLLAMLANNTDLIELDFRKGQVAHNPDQPLELDPQYNLVLLKVITGEGPTSFRVQNWDLVAEYPLSSFKVNISKQGTTYVMLKLNQIPEDGMVSPLAFVEEGESEPTYWHALTAKTKPWGHLAISVSDENGELVPALMQISSHQGKRLWEPPGAVDLRAQLNDIVPHLSHLGRGYVFFLPGKNRGRYWIVPKPLEMVLPEGKWDLTILHGPEYHPVRETIEIDADHWTRKNYTLKRWINMPQQGWYSGDDHVHARLINSEDAENLIQYTRAVDIHIANILEMGDPLRTYYAQRGFGKDFRVQHDKHWLVPGQEDPRSELGHAIGLNLQDKVRDLDRYLLNDWIAGEIHKQGGLYGHTHMGANACFVHREMAIFTPMEIVDFNSIMQAKLGTELFYDMLNLGFKMTASAGADTPYGGTIGATRVYAYTGEHIEFTPDRWFEALKNGKTFVTNGPMIKFTVNDCLPGEVIRVNEEMELTIHAVAEGLPGYSSPRSLKIVCLGETIDEIDSTDDSQQSLELNLSYPSGSGCWIAAHVVGHDGSEAHTTPVYVQRDGFRHWNVREAGRLIHKQLAAIDETEIALANSEELIRTRGAHLDYWNKTNAEQAEQVRIRLKKSTDYYQQLRKQLSAEKTLRKR